MKQPVNPNENGMAIAALVLGIVSLTGPGPLTGIPAIILGTISLRNPKNRGMSIAAIIMGCISIVFAILFVLLLLFLVVVAALSNSYDTYPQPMPLYDEPGASSVMQQRI